MPPVLSLGLPTERWHAVAQQDQTLKSRCEIVIFRRVSLSTYEFSHLLLTRLSGGIRGILELVILQKVIDEVGFDFPVQELFDLAIGTSTGECGYNCQLASFVN